MATLSERFVSEKREQWMRLRKILIKIREQSYRALQEEEIEDFARLYRLACADLARARTLQLSPDVIDYLNNIVGQAHNYLYSFPAVRRSQVKQFFTELLPGIIRQQRRVILLSAFFFFGSYLVTFILCLLDPDKASLVVSPGLLEQLAESYKSEVLAGRGVGMSTFALSFYIQHNVSIAFFSFAGGVLAGLGTVYFLVYNGLTLGAISGYIMAQGYGDHFLGFVTAHSVMELSGLVVAGAAGLLLGYTIIKASRFRKQDQLSRQKNNIFSLLCAAALMIISAAAIEGLISPQPLPYIVKAGIGLGSLALLLYYFGVLPLQRKSSGAGSSPSFRPARLPIFLIILLAVLLLTVSMPPRLLAAGDSTHHPTAREVIEAHQELIKKYGPEKADLSRKEPRQDKRVESEKSEDREEERVSPGFLEWLQGLSLPVIIIIVLILVILFYFMFRGVPGFFPGAVAGAAVKKPGVKSGADGAEWDRGGDEDYGAAVRWAKQGEYGRALVVLHQSSIKRLQENHWIPLGRNFTNNDIRRLIGESGTGVVFFTPFSQLAAAAERVAFKHENPGPEAYIKLEQSYEAVFLKMSTGGRF
jgi:uncharacterized membrane protein SpoIIM required for sporulation